MVNGPNAVTMFVQPFRSYTSNKAIRLSQMLVACFVLMILYLLTESLFLYLHDDDSDIKMFYIWRGITESVNIGLSFIQKCMQSMHFASAFYRTTILNY